MQGKNTYIFPASRSNGLREKQITGVACITKYARLNENINVQEKSRHRVGQIIGFDDVGMQNAHCSYLHQLFVILAVIEDFRATAGQVLRVCIRKLSSNFVKIKVGLTISGPYFFIQIPLPHL